MPSTRVSDAAAPLGLAVRGLRALAFLGSAFLLLLPLALFLSNNRRADAGFYMMAGYCLTVAVASSMALAFRDRFSFWAGLSINALGLACAAALLAYLVSSGDSDAWALLFLGVPTALNLIAVLVVRRNRGPSDDTVATR